MRGIQISLAMGPFNAYEATKRALRDTLSPDLQFISEKPWALALAERIGLRDRRMAAADGAPLVPDLRGARVLLLGAGGAARAIAHFLVEEIGSGTVIIANSPLPLPALFG